MKDLWTAVDKYIEETVIPPDAVLDSVLSASQAAGLPAIAVSAAQGKFLYLIAKMIGARRILEIGTLGGYSAIWMARALPKDGKLITLEVDLKHADVAKASFERAGLSNVIDLRLGKALETLPSLAGDTFDLVFIDADKQNIAEYFDLSVRMTRAGGVIIVDNVVREGKVLDANTDDQMVQGVRRFNAALKNDKRVDATTLQLTGVKGYDGMTIAVRI